MLKTAFYLDVYGISDVGLVRNHNEDAWKMNLEKSIFLVADGMGGHNAGEIASHLACEVAYGILETESHINEKILKKAFEEANAEVYKKSRIESAYHGMGTTLLAVAIDHDIAFFAHVGDSRLYLLRDNTLQKLTTDHTMVNELISLGTLNASDDATLFPFKHILTKAIGTHQKVEPSFGQIILKKNDQFFLATDGLTNYLSENEILAQLTQEISIKQKTEHLIELAKNNGGGDNITLILGMVLNHDLS